jgi:hypothetical protein
MTRSEQIQTRLGELQSMKVSLGVSLHYSEDSVDRQLFSLTDLEEEERRLLNILAEMGGKGK